MESSPELTVRVDVPHGEAAEAAVRQITWGDAWVAFPAAAAPVLLIGQALQLRFRGPSLPGEAVVRAFVRQRVEEDGARVYRFQLEHGDGTAFEAAVNRRSAFRVTPDPGAPVRVVLREPGGRRVGGVLRDLSESGMSALLGKEDEWMLAAAQVLDVEFFLPTSPLLLRFRVDVRHRRLERTAVHYGMRFETAGEGFEGAREAVQAYVTERQRAMRRRIEPDAPKAA
jgi:hypothetical protein